MSVRQRFTDFLDRHEEAWKPFGSGVVTAVLAALVVIAIDTKLSEHDDALVGRSIAVLVPALAALAATVAVLSPHLRAGFGFAAHALLTLYPFLLPDTPWWSLGAALAVHLVALSLQSRPWTRLGVAALGAPLLVQAAYRDDLGPYNPLVAGLALTLHVVLVWLLLPAGRWRRVPETLLLGGAVLLFLASGYSLTQALEWDRGVALVAGVVGALLVLRISQGPHASVALPSIPTTRLPAEPPVPS